MHKHKTKTIEIGSKIGHWLILEKVKVIQKRSSVFAHYLCRCECGTERIVRADGLRNGRSSQCRACRDKERYINIDAMIGTKIGRWQVLSGIKNKNGRQNRAVLCKCECGLEQIIDASTLKTGKTKSCHMCNVKKHGMEGTPTYNTWRCMKRRCYNKKNHNYHLYGGRGIKICERWHTFENFYEDMGKKPEGLQIDRTNNDGHYEPLNCRWVTPKQNSNNRRKKSQP